MVGCGLDPFRCTVDHGVELQYNKDPLVDDWEPVFPQCHINGHGVDMQCRPYQVRPGSVYTANSHPHWTRVSLMLPLKVFSRSVTPLLHLPLLHLMCSFLLTRSQPSVIFSSSLSFAPPLSWSLWCFVFAWVDKYPENHSSSKNNINIVIYFI